MTFCLCPCWSSSEVSAAAGRYLRVITEKQTVDPQSTEDNFSPLNSCDMASDKKGNLYLPATANALRLITVLYKDSSLEIEPSSEQVILLTLYETHRCRLSNLFLSLARRSQVKIQSASI